MDRFLVLVVMGCALLALGVIWRLVGFSMSWQRRTLIASVFMAAGAAYFYALQLYNDPVAAWMMVPLYGGAALVVLTINDPALELIQRAAEGEDTNRNT